MGGIATQIPRAREPDSPQKQQSERASVGAPLHCLQVEGMADPVGLEEVAAPAPTESGAQSRRRLPGIRKPPACS